MGSPPIRNGNTTNWLHWYTTYQQIFQRGRQLSVDAQIVVWRQHLGGNFRLWNHQYVSSHCLDRRQIYLYNVPTKPLLKDISDEPGSPRCWLLGEPLTVSHGVYFFGGVSLFLHFSISHHAVKLHESSSSSHQNPAFDHVAPETNPASKAQVSSPNWWLFHLLRYPWQWVSHHHLQTQFPPSMSTRVGQLCWNLSRVS